MSKARDIQKMTKDEALKRWPTYRDWLTQLASENENIEDRCTKCHKLLCSYGSIKPHEIDSIIENKLGPLTSPICAECAAKKAGGSDE